MPVPDIAVVGGGGHVGLPLALMFTRFGKSVEIYDIDRFAVEEINGGRMPFLEPGAQELLQSALESGLIHASTDPTNLRRVDTVIVVVGTPDDEYLQPNPNTLLRVLESLKGNLRDGQLIVLRSTLFPGVTENLERSISEWGLNVEIAFAPERISEHHAIRELLELPQIVASSTDSGFARAKTLFDVFGVSVIRLTPKEAELAKLFTNAWRYIKFAAANEFYMIAAQSGLDFEKIRKAMIFEYPRARDLPGAGFAAGPCLLKDTMQLAAYASDGFRLGNQAMVVNEGLPKFVTSRLAELANLRESTVGILGMSFKAGSDDIRSSLSYRLKKELQFSAQRVLTTDPLVRPEIDPTLSSLESVLTESDLIVVATPHEEYRDLALSVPTIDLWGITKNSFTID